MSIAAASERDRTGRPAIIRKLLTNVLFFKDLDADYIMQLKIKNMEASDSGVYYCNAHNNFGSFAQVLKLQTRQKSVSSFFA